MALNCDERSIQVFTSSMAVSKFFTYSPYIFRKGASFWRMSPIRGFTSLRVKVKSQGSSWGCTESLRTANTSHQGLTSHMSDDRGTHSDGEVMWEHQCVHFGLENEMTEELKEMFFLTQHCGTIQRTAWSLTFSLTLCLSRSYTIFVLSHSCFLWLCLTSFPLPVLSPPLSLSLPLLHLSLTPLSLPHVHILYFLPYFKLWDRKIGDENICPCWLWIEQLDYGDANVLTAI